jgi:hypothetical protein
MEKRYRELGEPAYLASFRLRPTMHRAQHGFLLSECSTILLVRLRAAWVENVTADGTSPPALPNPVRHAG